MIYVVLVVFGLALGSFINALIWRIHEQESSKKKKTNVKLSITKGRSMCPSCKHELGAKDLIPVISWLSLGGKCRYCKKAISAQYPIVELLTAALFVFSYQYLPSQPVLYLLALVGMIALFVYDLKWMILPDRIVFPMIGLAVAIKLVDFYREDFDLWQLGSAALGAFMLAGLFYALFMYSKGRWIGGGDVKLAIFIGILVGPLGAYLTLMLASLFGSVVIVTLMALKVVKRSQPVPFGPFLIAATYIVLVFGEQIIDWYSNNFLAGLL